MIPGDVHCPRCGENLGPFPVELPSDIELEQICGHLTVRVIGPAFPCPPDCAHWSHEDGADL